MKYSKISLDLIQEIPAIEAMAEGKLRGGFSSLSVAAAGNNVSNDDCNNDFCSNNDNCKNKVCNNSSCNNNSDCSNGKCTSTTAAPTSTSTPTPSGCSLIGGSFSVLGF